MDSVDNPKFDKQSVILFADDDDLCLDVGVKMLQKLGYEVLDACDGKEALKVFIDYKNKIDLVILDMKMPNDGSTTFSPALFRFRCWMLKVQNGPPTISTLLYPVRSVSTVKISCISGVSIIVKALLSCSFCLCNHLCRLFLSAKRLSFSVAMILCSNLVEIN